MLLEVVVALALLAIASSALIVAQMNALERLTTAMHDTQSLGLVVEVLEMHAIGHTTPSSEVQQRLQAIDPKRQLSLSTHQGLIAVTLKSPANFTDAKARTWTVPSIDE